LNAHNILLVGDDLVYLLDFDRGRLMRPGMWCDSNLVRLRRSLEKITYGLPPEHFSEADWHGLLDGYRQSRGHPGASAPTATGASTPIGQSSGTPTHAGPAPRSRERPATQPLDLELPAEVATPTTASEPSDSATPPARTAAAQ
jgi:hypothetical protein